jgi:DNA modification methylase
MKYKLHDKSLVVCGNAFTKETQECVDVQYGTYDNGKGFIIPQFKLTICDPPYGGIVDDELWDDKDDYWHWFDHCALISAQDSTICMWGGTGKKGNRPFIKFAADFEERYGESWEIKNWITWGKRRAYGVQDNYLYTREECLIITRGNPTFNIPLLKEKRGYAGYNEEYPAKSEYLRRTNVWTDINELFRNKIHKCQKPDELYEVLVLTHSDPGDVVYDPCAGSATTARAATHTGRRFCIVEQHEEYLRKAELL